MPKKSSDATLARQILACLRARDRGKAAYQRSDKILDQLLTIMQPGQAVALPDGKQATLVDLYAGRNKVFRAHGIGRFEIQIKVDDA